MAQKIVPALLTDDKKELDNMFLLCKSFCSYVQIDIMDGQFVPSISVSLNDLKNTVNTVDNELHLMVDNPRPWIDAAVKLNSKRVIVHIEINNDIDEIINLIKKRSIEVGLAINPSTDISRLYNFSSRVNSVLFMSVEPGFYGAPFIPSVLGKIRKFRERFPQKEIGIDGGIKLDNLDSVLDSGVDYICIGSAILKSSDPAESYRVFVQKVETYHA